MSDSTPVDLVEFQHRFADERACWLYLFQLRWPQGFQCPACGGPEYYELLVRRLLECRQCGHQTSVTAGTLMHGTKLPLRDWFWAAFLVARHKRGISAAQIQRDLHLGSYETAWMLLHKLRKGLVESPDRFERLVGRVELDDAYVGGVEAGAKGRGTTTKAKIVVAVEVAGTGCGRATLTVVQAMSKDELEAVTRASVAPGATVTTDGHASYDGLGTLGYKHDRKVEGTPANAGLLFPRVHRVISNLKRWMLCTHAGRVAKKHLQSYLNEFQYRFNRRGHVVDIFRRALQRLTFQGPFTYDQLIASAAT